MMQCLHCYVSGRVQGVWYRASTQRRAQELELNGYARNLADGRVEVVACGEDARLRQLREWLWQGSTAAEVDNVECSRVDGSVPEGFTTG